MSDSKREQVLQAVLALIETACSGADVKRNAPKPSKPAAGGVVRMRDGDPGEPTVDLSPLTYNFEHKIPLEILVPGGAGREAALDALMRPIGAAVAADRTLGGLCMFLEVESPTTSDIEATGAETGLWADAAIVAHYATQDPLN